MNAIKESPRDLKLGVQFDHAAKPKFGKVVATINQLEFESLELQVYAAFYAGFCCGYLTKEGESK